MTGNIKEIRKKTRMTQKEFASSYGIPLSTLRKWEQGEAAPPDYVVTLIAKSAPVVDNALEEIRGRNGEVYYYDGFRRRVSDAQGNWIAVKEDLEGICEQNLSLYVTELFDAFHEIQERFDRDCRYDKKEDILWV